MSKWKTVLMLGLMSVVSFTWALKGPFELKVLPVFSAKGLSGDQVTYQVLSEGGVVAFFRSSCGYCLLEFPIWDEIRKEFPDVVMILVTHREDVSSIQRFLDHHGNVFNHVIDDSDNMLWRTFGASQTPETFVFSRDSRVVGHFGYIGKNPRPIVAALKRLG